jgi:hypothetical protein
MSPQPGDDLPGKPPRLPWRQTTPHWVYYRPGGGRGGASGGVREPRAPRPGSGSGAVRLEPPRA